MFAGQEIFERANALHAVWTRIAADAYHALHPEAGECHWTDGDCSAVFAGDGNPLTQCYGLGIGSGDPSARLDALAVFFGGRAAKWELILTPYEPPAVWNLAVERGYRFDHFENMLFMPTAEIKAAPPTPLLLQVEEVPPNQVEAWGDLSLRAFCGEELPPWADDLKALLSAATASRRYWGMWDGEPVAAASFTVVGDTAFLGGMGTLAAYRGKGFQQALLHRRVRDAFDTASLALVEALPGSSSHRNAERTGFRVAYTSAVMLYDDSAGK